MVSTQVAGYQVGYGPIAWLLLSELFGNRARGKALAVGVQLNFGCNLAVNFLFPSLLSALGGTRPGGTSARRRRGVAATRR